MYRVALTAGIAAALAGCSLGASTITSGFSDDSKTTASISKPTAKSVGLGGEPAVARAASAKGGVQLAKLDDRAPNGSFEKAAPGILADRDYSRTQLDAEMARDLINSYRKQKGLKPLKLNPELTAAAKAHVYGDASEPSGYFIERIVPAMTIQDMLALVQYFPNDLVRRMQEAIRAQQELGVLRPREGVALLDRYSALLGDNTYMQPDGGA